MKKKKIDPVEQEVKYVEFLKKALASENFKNNSPEDYEKTRNMRRRSSS